jgi:hypothetical protein
MQNIPKKNDNPNYYACFVIFQTYKNTISIHLGGSFDCVFTLVYEQIQGFDVVFSYFNFHTF